VPVRLRGNDAGNVSSVEVVVDTRVGVADPGPGRNEVGRLRRRADEVRTVLVEQEIEMAVDPRVEDADLDETRAGLDRVRLRSVDVHHAPLLELKRIFGLLGPAARHAVGREDLELPARDCFVVARKRLPHELLGRLGNERRRAEQVNEQRVRRLDREHAYLAREVDRHCSTG
jgi:hypothetical protein